MRRRNLFRSLYEKAQASSRKILGSRVGAFGWKQASADSESGRQQAHNEQAGSAKLDGEQVPAGMTVKCRYCGKWMKAGIYMHEKHCHARPAS